MKAIGSLLALTDFSEHAGYALQRAARIAAGQRAKLAVLHVISDSFIATSRELGARAPEVEARLIAGSESALEREAARLAEAAGVRATWSVRIGGVLNEILDSAASADLLVMGARGANPVRDFLLGTTAERLLGRCPLPLLVVRRAPAGEYRKVIVPVDFSPVSASALRAALQVAPTAAVVVCHALEYLPEATLQLAGVSPDETGAQLRQRAQASVDELVRSVVPPGRGHVESALMEGHPAMAILEQQAGDGADLIVFGKQGRSAMDFLLGSVTRHVLAGAKCDVLVVSRD